MTKYDDINCDSLTNLTILDPPRWGWSAAGGIVDLCPPHEKARRKAGTRDFLNKQQRERKKAAREKAQATANEVMAASPSSSKMSASSSSSSSSPSKKSKKSSLKSSSSTSKSKSKSKVKSPGSSGKKGKDLKSKSSPKKKKMNAVGAAVVAASPSGAVKADAKSLVDSSSSVKSEGASAIVNANANAPPKDTMSSASTTSAAIAKPIDTSSVVSSATNAQESPAKLKSETEIKTEDSKSVSNPNTTKGVSLPPPAAAAAAASDLQSVATATTATTVTTAVLPPSIDRTGSAGPGGVPDIAMANPDQDGTKTKTNTSTTITTSTTLITKIKNETDPAPIAVAKPQVLNHPPVGTEASKPSPDTTTAIDTTSSTATSTTPQKQPTASAHPTPTPTAPTTPTSTTKTPNQSPTKHKPKLTPGEAMLEKYGISSDSYKAIVKPKGVSKRDRFDLEVQTTLPDGTVHPDAYHRGHVGSEPRFKGRGNLICDTKPTDTNHGWDEPNLKLQVKIEFPLGEPEWSDEEDEESHHSNKNEQQSGRRRNARRGGEGRTFVSETDRRKKREEKLAALPKFREVVQWDLGYAKTPTPMVYAADVAAQFGLSFNRTLDLARSIQDQIDDFVRENVNYHVPISILDNMDVPRGKSGLQPPKYSNPKILYGGHCATDVTTTSKRFEPREKKSISKDGGGSGSISNVSNDPSNVKTINVLYDVAPRDQLPKHDFSGLGLDPIYGKMFLRRAKQANKDAIKKVADGNIGQVIIRQNHSCHFCHIRRPRVIQYPCGNDAHCFCDLHTSRRFGYKISQAVAKPIDYCPICSLKCTCYRCTGRANTLVPQFAKACKDQGVGPEEVKFDFVFQCSRNLHRFVKKSNEKKSNSSSTSTRRKTQAAVKIQQKQPEKKKYYKPVLTTAKVPKDEFPAEFSGGLNRDPSRKDDYNTIFTPDGNKLCEEAVKKSQELEAKLKPAIVLDGNVDYCDICRSTGNLVCCDKCPRSFHGYCLPDDTKASSGRWECPRCTDDSTGVEMKGEVFLEKLLDIFKQFKESPNFNSKIVTLSKIFDMIKYLSGYDYGDTFSEPVDVKFVRDYRTYVKRPMDLGTISKRLLEGEYCNISKQRKDFIEGESASEMDIVIFNILKDVEQIWHNCFSYNREGSSFNRMGRVLQQKCKAIRSMNFENELDSFVKKNLEAFVQECKAKREELSHSLKPWIQPSKYQINVPTRGSISVKRNIGVYDIESNMIIKQYTGFSAAYSVVEFLTKLGHASEIGLCNKQNVKDHIIAMHKIPELLLFGYKWLYMDDVRAGKYKINKSNAVVKKICKISNSVMAEYESISDAFKAWLDAVGKSVGSASSIKDENKSQMFFEKCYLDGQGSIDEQEWVRVQRPNVAVPIPAPAKPVAMEICKVQPSATGTDSSKNNTTEVKASVKMESVRTVSNIKSIEAVGGSTVIQKSTLIVSNVSIKDCASVDANPESLIEIEKVSKPTPIPVKEQTSELKNQDAANQSVLKSSKESADVTNVKVKGSRPIPLISTVDSSNSVGAGDSTRTVKSTDKACVTSINTSVTIGNKKLEQGAQRIISAIKPQGEVPAHSSPNIQPSQEPTVGLNQSYSEQLITIKPLGDIPTHSLPNIQPSKKPTVVLNKAYSEQTSAIKPPGDAISTHISPNMQPNAAVGLNTSHTEQSETTPTRSAIDIDLAASLLDFARTASTPDSRSVASTPDSGKLLPVKKRAIGNISGDKIDGPDSKRPHGIP